MYLLVRMTAIKSLAALNPRTSTVDCVLYLGNTQRLIWWQTTGTGTGIHCFLRICCEQSMYHLLHKAAIQILVAYGSEHEHRRLPTVSWKSAATHLATNYSLFLGNLKLAFYVSSHVSGRLTDSFGLWVLAPAPSVAHCILGKL